MDRLIFDSNNKIQPYTLILSDRTHSNIGRISGVTHLNLGGNLNSPNEISFTVHRSISTNEGVVDNPIWEGLQDLGFVWVKEKNEYYEIAVTINEEDEAIKNVVGLSACEAELSNLFLYTMEINTESDITRKEYKKPTVFYNSSEPENSLLHRILADKAPHYRIGRVDSSLQALQRSFSVSGASIYDFLTKTLAEEVGCLFLFDSATRTISAHDLENRCVDCGTRIGTEIICPDCNSADIIMGYGDDTEVFVNRGNLAKSVTIEGDKDSVKNCFKISGGDDTITAMVRSCNPSGTEYIYYFSDEQRALMPSDLVAALNEYDAIYAGASQSLSPLIEALFGAYDRQHYLTSSMMPTVETSETNAGLELAKLNNGNMKSVAVTSLLKASKATVDNTVLGYAKVFVSPTFKVEIESSTYNTATYSWAGKFKVTNFSDSSDTATSISNLQITVNEDFETFIKQKVEKILGEKEIKDIEEDWALYALTPLASFFSAYSAAIDSLQELGLADKDHEFYTEIYLKYKDRLDNLSAEMKVRESQIAEVETTIEATQQDIRAIQNTCDLRQFLQGKESPDDLWIQLRTFIRESEYSNENYISDGLNNAEAIKKAKELIAVANREIKKASVVQHTISTTLANIFARKEFETLWDKFALGNWIREEIDEKIYRLRLIKFAIDFENIGDSTVTFSDVMQTGSGMSDLQNILNQSQSMAHSYSYVAKQASTSYKNSHYVENWIGRGLDTTNVKIVNNAKNQTVTYDEHGILTRRLDEEGTGYFDEQLKIINGGIYITDDNWRSLRTGIGLISYIDPDTQKLTYGYGVNTDLLIGRLLLTEKLMISNANNDFKIDEDGISFENGISQFKVDSKNVKGLLQINKYDPLTQEYEHRLHIDSNGNIIFRDGQILGPNTVIGGGASIGDASINWQDVTHVGKIDAGHIDAESLDANIANIVDLTSNHITARLLDVQMANIVNANIENLVVDIAKISTLITGSAVIDDALVVHLTSSNVIIDDAVITNLIAKQMTVSDLAAGAINTKDFVVQSDNGKAGLKIVGNTLQMYDAEGNVGIQLGYTSSLTDPDSELTRPSLILTDSTGALMLDSSGLHPAIVPDQFIKQDMIGDKAVGDAQIDWQSTKSVVDDDGNSLWITADQVLNSQEFTTKFTTIGESIDATNSTITTLESSMNAADNEIRQKVVESEFYKVDGDIVKDENGNPVTISEKMVEQVLDVDSIRFTVAETSVMVGELEQEVKNGRIYQNALPPDPPTIDQLWLDTSTHPSTLRKYTQNEAGDFFWETVNDYDGDLEELRESIRKANTLIDQTANEIRMEAESTYVNGGEFEEYKKTSLAMTDEKVELKFRDVSDRVDEVKGEVTKNKRELETYIRMDIDGVEIGREESPVKAVYDNTGMAIKENGDTIAEFRDKQARMQNAHVENTLTQGRKGVGVWAWEVDSNGRLNLRSQGV